MKLADIVVSACGKERTITGSVLKSGVIVIDGGIVKEGTRVLGDVDRAVLKNSKASCRLSPAVSVRSPSCLLSNVVEAAKRQLYRAKSKNGEAVFARHSRKFSERKIFL